MCTCMRQREKTELVFSYLHRTLVQPSDEPASFSPTLAESTALYLRAASQQTPNGTLSGLYMQDKSLQLYLEGRAKKSTRNKTPLIFCQRIS